jgi:hypothetical protein
MLAYITGTVDQELLLRNEYLAAENRILRAQIQGRLLRCATTKLTFMRKEITKAKTTYCYSLCRLKQSVENRKSCGVGNDWVVC